jgi:hypothetical protein
LETCFSWKSRVTSNTLRPGRASDGIDL